METIKRIGTIEDLLVGEGRTISVADFTINSVDVGNKYLAGGRMDTHINIDFSAELSYQSEQPDYGLYITALLVSNPDYNNPFSVSNTQELIDYIKTAEFTFQFSFDGLNEEASSKFWVHIEDRGRTDLLEELTDTDNRGLQDFQLIDDGYETFAYGGEYLPTQMIEFMEALLNKESKHPQLQNVDYPFIDDLKDKLTAAATEFIKDARWSN